MKVTVTTEDVTGRVWFQLYSDVDTHMQLHTVGGPECHLAWQRPSVIGREKTSQIKGWDEAMKVLQLHGKNRLVV